MSAATGAVVDVRERLAQMTREEAERLLERLARLSRHPDADVALMALVAILDLAELTDEEAHR